MSSLYDRNGVYQVQYTDTRRRPTYRRFSLKTRSERAALRLKARADHLYETGAWDPWERSLDEAMNPTRQRKPVRTWSLRAAAERFAARPELTPGTRATYEQILSLMFEHAGGDAPETAPDAARMARWLASGTEGRAATYARHIRAFERWAKAEGLVPASVQIAPTTKAKNRPALVFFTPDEIAAIETTIAEEADLAEQLMLLPIVATTPYTGLRLKETCEARVSWYDSAAQTLVVPGSVAKSRKDGSIHVPSAAVPVYEVQAERSKSGYLFELRGKPVHPGHLSNRFRYWREKAGVEDGSFHTLRHTCASWLAQGGAPLNVIQRHLRHATIDTTMRYVHLMPKHEATLLDTAFRASSAEA